MASSRRVGSETSKTRQVLLDCVERLLTEQGHTAVTYRAVAAEAGVTSGLVQYYFPTLEDLFVAAIRRGSERHVARLTAALRARPDQPLHVLWEHSRDESTAAITTELLALGNRLKSIRAEIAAATERARRIQLDALQQITERTGLADGDFSPAALAFLVTAIPRMIRLERGVGISSAHAEVVDAFERYLDTIEGD
jgi:TetR/AcrR family transcriptional repressor of nem operon